MANGDYGYFGKGDTGYAQYMTAFNRTIIMVVWTAKTSAALAPPCRMRQAACPASIGAEWKEQIEADFQKRHQG